ncbi:MAG: hypothetical protein Kapaf2KO_00950 [Candidatus Kapaibacteriales bacterium]
MKRVNSLFLVFNNILRSILFIILIGITNYSCDPVRLIQIVNNTQNEVEITFYGVLNDKMFLDSMSNKNKFIYELILRPNDKLEVGSVIGNRYPRESDIDVDSIHFYLTQKAEIKIYKSDILEQINEKRFTGLSILIDEIKEIKTTQK